MEQQGDIRVIREALEAVLSPSLTSAILFEAMDQSGAVPQSTEDLRVLVRGALARALATRLGEAQARQVVAEIEDRLVEVSSSGMKLRPDVEVEIELDPDEVAAAIEHFDDQTTQYRRNNEDTTTTIPTGPDPVVVAVVAASKSFASRLSIALGPRRVSPAAVRSLGDLTDMAVEPPIVLVDATDFPSIEPSALVESLASMPSTTLRVVWASELPYGRRLVGELERAAVPCTPLDRKEGIEPLLDMVRARQRPSEA